MAVHAPTHQRCLRHSLHLSVGDSVLHRGQWRRIADFTQDGIPAAFVAGTLVVLEVEAIEAWRQALPGGLN